ncbi:MAG TPA: NERD domain-containing protein [Streptosporangiaceae bacterium]|nr:NERD domain-containing protein [Streptosporangiaceae bacterium]
MDRETGPEPTPTGPAAPVEGPQNVPVPARALMAGLVADPRLPYWIRRAVISVVVFLPVMFWQGWRLGVTFAAIVAIIDTIYRSRTMALIPAAVRVSSAQRRTKRRLFVVRVSGYLALHARCVPGTRSIIDHLVIGPGGVYALDSERWDRRLPVRTVASDSAAGPVLYHGPFSQKDRLAHARWEAGQATRLLSRELGREITVRPAMVIYGPAVPWAVATLRGVDVFAGRSVGRYFRSRKRTRIAGPLGWEEAGEIFAAAQRALPLA